MSTAQNLSKSTVTTSFSLNRGIADCIRTAAKDRKTTMSKVIEEAVKDMANDSVRGKDMVEVCYTGKDKSGATKSAKGLWIVPMVMENNRRVFYADNAEEVLELALHFQGQGCDVIFSSKAK